jgi:hypothetical protein
MYDLGKPVRATEGGGGEEGEQWRTEPNWGASYESMEMSQLYNSYKLIRTFEINRHS